jgi:hypothetical protein
MSEGWWLFLVYAGSVLATTLAAWWGIRQHGRAEDALDDVDQAYRDGYEDGSGGLVLEPGGLRPRGRHGDGQAADQLELWHEPGRRPAGYELAQMLMWAEALRSSPLGDRDGRPEHAPFCAEQHPPGMPCAAGPYEPLTDERLERVVLPLTETDTGWMRRVDDDQAEAWQGSADRIEQLANEMYQRWKDAQL